MTWNLEDFFLYPDEPEPRRQPNKPLWKIRAIAKQILSLQPDIVGLCEVGGPESLERFNQLFLEGGYRVFCVEGNSDRGIDVGYLVRERSGLSIEKFQSYRERPIGFSYDEQQMELPLGTEPGALAAVADEAKANSVAEGERFSRDVARLSVRDKARGVGVELLLVHLKSRLDPKGQDPNGKRRRRAEFQCVLQIASEVRAERGGVGEYVHCPIILMGDFNGQPGGIEAEPEFAGLAEAGFVDVLAESGQRWFDRVTHVGGLVSTGKGFVLQERQLDGFLLEESFFREVGIERVFVERLGTPITLEAKAQLPSDHHPVIMDIFTEGDNE